MRSLHLATKGQPPLKAAREEQGTGSSHTAAKVQHSRKSNSVPDQPLHFSFLVEHAACGSPQHWTDGFLCFESLIVVRLLTRVQLFVTPWTTARQASLSFTLSWSLLKPISIESVMPSNHLILWHPLLFLPSIFPSIRVFSNESALRIRWPKYWSFTFHVSPSNEYSRLISFRMDWFGILAY